MGEEAAAGDGDDVVSRVVAAHGGEINRAEALEWLRSTSVGREFARAHKGNITMQDTEKLKAAYVAKLKASILEATPAGRVMKAQAARIEKLEALPPVEIAKSVIAGHSEDNFGLTESEFCGLIEKAARKQFPNLSTAQAFSKVFTASTEEGKALRLACETLKRLAFAAVAEQPRGNYDEQYSKRMAEEVRKLPITVSLQPLQVGGKDVNVNDPSEAIAQLQRLGEVRWPDLTREQQFSRAFSDPANRELAAKAHVRPSGHPSFAR